MASPTATPARSVSPVILLVSLLCAVGITVGIYFLNRPQQPVRPVGPSAEAKAYLSNLALSDVEMKATENFMKQQVVEVDGRIANNGPRPIQRIDVYCIFRGVNGQEIYRERVPVATGLAPNQSKSFRLPFDTLPDTWNQAVPTLVIAQIAFGQ